MGGKRYGIKKKGQTTQRGFKSLRHLEKRASGVRKQLKVKLPEESYTTLSNKTPIQEDTCTTMFTEVLFTTAKTGKQPKRPLTDEGSQKMSSRVQWNVTQP